MSLETADREQAETQTQVLKTGGRPKFRTEDPATGRLGREYQGHSLEEALAIARDVQDAFRDWRWRLFSERAKYMKSAAATLRHRREEFADLMTAEMGKTRTRVSPRSKNARSTAISSPNTLKAFLPGSRWIWEAPKLL